MKPVDVNSGIYIDFNKKNNKEDLDMESRIPKYKSIFANGYY